jgi:hypothetical protein
MSIVTELALFKTCCEKPKVIPALSSLNLTKVSDPLDVEGLTEEQICHKKAMKLFHLVWSGVTKTFNTVCLVTNRCIEFPGLGIFNPTISEGTGVTKLSKNTLG